MAGLIGTEMGKDYGFGKREDGSNKGMGYFGKLNRPDGNFSTELSIGVNLSGKQMEVPLLVPTLTNDEIKSVLSGQGPTKEMVDKAVQFAIERMKSGKSVWAQPGEQNPMAGRPPVKGAIPGVDGSVPVPGSGDGWNQPGNDGVRG